MLTANGVRTVALLLMTCVGPAMACAGARTPAAPTMAAAITPSASTDLTVRVLTRGSELPIAGATVFQGTSAVGTTDGIGELRTNVPVDVEFHISVDAPGFVGLGASGTVRSEERWTFYLESAAK